MKIGHWVALASALAWTHPIADEFSCSDGNCLCTTPEVRTFSGHRTSIRASVCSITRSRNVNDFSVRFKSSGRELWIGPESPTSDRSSNMTFSDFSGSSLRQSFVGRYSVELLFRNLDTGDLLDAIVTAKFSRKKQTTIVDISRAFRLYAQLRQEPYLSFAVRLAVFGDTSHTRSDGILPRILADDPRLRDAAAPLGAQLIELTDAAFHQGISEIINNGGATIVACEEAVDGSECCNDDDVSFCTGGPESIACGFLSANCTGGDYIENNTGQGGVCVGAAPCRTE